jgi:hypothetical protein
LVVHWIRTNRAKCPRTTTKSESFGNTFIESMICGVPVVASNIMPINELVVNGVTGLLYHGQNVDNAVKKLYQVLDQPGLHQQMSTEAIKRVTEKFAIEKVAEEYTVLLIEEIVELIPDDWHVTNEEKKQIVSSLVTRRKKLLPEMMGKIY